MSLRPPRSVRNNNPGNLERSSIEWLGLATVPEMNAEQRVEQIFCVFRSPMFGFRALALDLYNSWKKGRMTLTQLISHFAPPNENDTKSYIYKVSLALDMLPDQPLHLDNDEQLATLCRAISIQEAGYWAFDANDLVTGVAMSRLPSASRLVA